MHNIQDLFFESDVTQEFFFQNYKSDLLTPGNIFPDNLAHMVYHSFFVYMGTRHYVTNVLLLCTKYL